MKEKGICRQAIVKNALSKFPHSFAYVMVAFLFAASKYITKTSLWTEHINTLPVIENVIRSRKKVHAETNSQREEFIRTENREISLPNKYYQDIFACFDKLL